MGDAKRPDETIPGGKYLNAAHDRYVDAWGKDMGPADGEPETADPAPVELSAEQRSALRAEFFAEFMASIVNVEGEELETESFEFDVVAAYEAYTADERANGSDDQMAFQDAVLGVFGVSVQASEDDNASPDSTEPNPVTGSTPEAEPKPKGTRKKAAD